MAQNYSAIPLELRNAKQWAVAGLDEKTGKHKIPNIITLKGLRRADTTNITAFSDFETTRKFAEENQPNGLGFVLSKTDPYVCIDLDVKNKHNEADPSKWTTAEQLERFQKIVMSFHSYTEMSAGGYGYHIWLKGSLGAGLKRDGVEIYSQERFIVCTGNVVLNTAIVEKQELLDLLATEMRKTSIPALSLVDLVQTEDDNTLFQRAADASNGTKFKALCNGDWKELGFYSQSEADESLLTILAFYSKSNAQCYRMFRMTALGQREKAHRKPGANGLDYLATTMLRVRNHEANEKLDTAVGDRLAKSMLQQLAVSTPVAAPASNANLQPQVTPSSNETNPLKRGNLSFLFAERVEAKLKHLQEEVQDEKVKPVAPGNGLEWPPGMTGEIARHIFVNSPRPVREVSIVAALGMMAGICGKAYHIPQSGLNVYMVLVAKSGVGKESMHTGISQIITGLAGQATNLSKFFDFTDYASGQALTKAVIANPAMLNLCGEWGKKLQRISSDEKGDGPMQSLRTAMTTLYQKSGPDSMFGGLGYSDKDKNTGSVTGVAYSMIGESTPGQFYDSLTETMMADGFLSRFVIVEYRGDRPDGNYYRESLPAHIGTKLTNLSNADMTAPSILVTKDDEALKLLQQFDKLCDYEIRKTDNEAWRQMWNRAHLKVARIAALLCIPDGEFGPVIQAQHVEWAKMLVLSDIKIMTLQMEAGNVGMGDATRESKLINLCKEFFRTESLDIYGVPAAMKADGVVPRKFFQIKTQKVTSFTTHRLGQIAALDQSLRSLVDGGYLVEVEKSKAVQSYQFYGKCYKILNLPMTTAESAQYKINQQINKTSTA